MRHTTPNPSNTTLSSTKAPEKYAEEEGDEVLSGGFKSSTRPPISSPTPRITPTRLTQWRAMGERAGVGDGEVEGESGLLSLVVSRAM